MTLSSYLEAHKITQAEFARRIGCDRSNFHRILTKPDVKPTLELAIAIERETGGKITAASWVGQARAA